MHLVFFAKYFQVRYVFMKIEHFESFKKRSWTRLFGQCRPKFDVCLLIGGSSCKVNLCEAVFVRSVCEFPKVHVLLQRDLNEISSRKRFFFICIFFNEKVDLTAVKCGLNEFLWSRFLNDAPSNSSAADCSFSFRFWIIEVISYKVKMLFGEFHFLL